MASTQAWLPTDVHAEAAGNYISQPVIGRLEAGAVLIGEIAKGNCQVT